MPEGRTSRTTGAITRSDAAQLRARSGDSMDFLSFLMDDELYAVQLTSVQEIVVPPPITPVPRSPSAVRGVCSVRGQLVTVIDLRACFDLESAKTSRRQRILLGRGVDEEVIGLQVDEVKQVVRLMPGEIEMTTQTLGGEVSEAVRGIGRPSTGEVLVLVDMQALVGKGVA